MRVGVLTSGGDCPGLNAVIRAVVRKGEMHYGDEIVGFLDAWDGVMDRRVMPLDVRSLLRHDHLLVRQFETETDRALRLVVDATASMGYRGTTAPASKIAWASSMVRRRQSGDNRS